jgi:hypothetical protein
MYQNPPRYVPGPPVGQFEPPPRRSLFRRLLFPSLLVGALSFGISYEVMPEPQIEVLPGIAYADGAFHVAYERHGRRGLFQVLTQDADQVRMATVDARTGEVRSDTRVPDDAVERQTAPTPEPTATEVALPGTRDRVVLEPFSFGIPALEGLDVTLPGQQLVLVTADGRSRQVDATMYQAARLVTAAVPGHVLIQHQGAGVELSMVQVETGLVTGTLTIDQPVTSAVAGPDGIAVMAGSTLAVAHTDGRITEVTIGEVDFFGSTGD